MQNRYVGDIGDFGKYGLLRALASTSSGAQSAQSLGVSWYLFPDEGHNNDGRHISYLKKEGYRELDPQLFDVIHEIVSNNNRHIEQIRNKRIFPFGTTFFEEHVAYQTSLRNTKKPLERLKARSEWFEDCLSALAGCDIVFLDPDNGIRPRSISKTHPKAGKFVFWEEIAAFARRRQSLIVYHHTNRSAPVNQQVEVLKIEISRHLPVGFQMIPLVFRRGSCRVFWLIISPEQLEVIRRMLSEFLESGWQKHFELMSDCTILDHG